MNAVLPRYAQIAGRFAASNRVNVQLVTREVEVARASAPFAPPHVSRTVPHNGLHPALDETVECVAEQPEDAFVSFHVYDGASSTQAGAGEVLGAVGDVLGGHHGGALSREHHELLAYEVVPMHVMRTGFRVVRLRAPSGQRLELSTLTIHSQFSIRTGGFHEAAAPSLHEGSHSWGSKKPEHSWQKSKRG